MKEHPILFNAPMVQATLAGRKKHTRRPMNLGRPRPNARLPRLENMTADDILLCYRSPFGGVGDRLWVKETWQAASRFRCTESAIGGRHPIGDRIYYAADDNGFVGTPWRPSIHMPRCVARIFLRVTGLRVERLQDISEYDCFAEGYKPREFYRELDANVAAAQLARISGSRVNSAAKSWFCDLWDSIYGDGPHSWDRNPWVWVTTFEREAR